MTTLRVPRAIVFAVATSLGGAAAAFAQNQKPTVKMPHGAAILFGAGYSTPTTATAALAVLIPTGKPYIDGDLGTLTAQRGIEIEASAGLHGARLAIGHGHYGKDPISPFLIGVDLLGNVTRTWNSPTHASDDSTYAGVAAGMTFALVRVTLGVAHRIAGPDGPKATIFTWSVGLQIPLKW